LKYFEGYNNIIVTDKSIESGWKPISIAWCTKTRLATFNLLQCHAFFSHIINIIHISLVSRTRLHLLKLEHLGIFLSFITFNSTCLLNQVKNVRTWFGARKNIRTIEMKKLIIKPDVLNLVWQLGIVQDCLSAVKELSPKTDCVPKTLIVEGDDE